MNKTLLKSLLLIIFNTNGMLNEDVDLKQLTEEKLQQQITSEKTIENIRNDLDNLRKQMADQEKELPLQVDKRDKINKILDNLRQQMADQEKKLALEIQKQKKEAENEKEEEDEFGFDMGRYTPEQIIQNMQEERDHSLKKIKYKEAELQQQIGKIDNINKALDNLRKQMADQEQRLELQIEKIDNEKKEL